MVFLFQQVSDGCALSDGCHRGTMVPVPHLREPCGNCPGKAGTLTPCPIRAEPPWGICEVSQHVTPPSSSASQGTWRTMLSRTNTHECERPKGRDWPTTRHPYFLHRCIGKISWEGARQAGGGLTLQGTRVGGHQRTVEAWGRRRDCAFICYSEPVVPLEPGRRARGSAWSHTRTARKVVSAHLHESSHQTPMKHSL